MLFFLTSLKKIIQPNTNSECNKKKKKKAASKIETVQILRFDRQADVISTWRLFGPGYWTDLGETLLLTGEDVAVLRGPWATLTVPLNALVPIKAKLRLWSRHAMSHKVWCPAQSLGPSRAKVFFFLESELRRFVLLTVIPSLTNICPHKRVGRSASTCFCFIFNWLRLLFFFFPLFFFLWKSWGHCDKDYVSVWRDVNIRFQVTNMLTRNGKNRLSSPACFFDS